MANFDRREAKTKAARSNATAIASGGNVMEIIGQVLSPITLGLTPRKCEKTAISGLTQCDLRVSERQRTVFGVAISLFAATARHGECLADSGQHSLIRKQFAARRCLSSADLAKLPHGRRVRFAGLVRMRQRPETASGVTFVTLQDEHGMVNAVVWQRTAEEQRCELLESSLMAIDGRLERADGVQHLIVSQMENYGGLLAKLQTGSRDFR
jgi:hypothetical protein